jgi:hypothetical protein
MWDVLDVYLDGATDPVEVPVLTVYVVDYRDLCDKAKVTAYPAGLDSAVRVLRDCRPRAPRPQGHQEVGREHKVIIERREHVGPTKTATPAV